MTGRAYFRCRCGATTLYGEPGEPASGECPTCGPMFAVPNDGGGEGEPTIEDYRRALALVIAMAGIDFGHQLDSDNGYLSFADDEYGGPIYNPAITELLFRVWPTEAERKEARERWYGDRPPTP